jgi:hypothetical protein
MRYEPAPSNESTRSTEIVLPAVCVPLGNSLQILGVAAAVAEIEKITAVTSNTFNSIDIVFLSISISPLMKEER